MTISNIKIYLTNKKHTIIAFYLLNNKMFSSCETTVMALHFNLQFLSNATIHVDPTNASGEKFHDHQETEF